MTKTIFKNSLTIAIIGLVISLFVVPFCFAQEQVGWLKGWKYRRPIILHNYSKTELSDYQVKIQNRIYQDSGLLAEFHFEKLADTTPDSASGKVVSVKGGKLSGAKAGKGLRLNGVSDYVDTGSVGLVKTIEFYINDDNYTDGIMELGKGVYVFISSGKIKTEGINTPLIYVNAKLQGDFSAGINHIVISTDTPIKAEAVKIGVANSDYMEGIIDEVRLYDWKLKEGDISARYQEKSKLDYSDVRFTDSNGTTLLNYYFDRKGAFWVKIPYLAVDINHPIFIYYGNDRAASLSNSSAVFDFYEDFEGKDLKQWISEGWTVSGEGMATAKTQRALLSRQLSLPVATPRTIEISAAIEGDLARNYLIFYENSRRKLAWEETGGFVKKTTELNSANPTIGFMLNTDGKNPGMIDSILVYKRPESVTVDIYPEISK